MEILLIFISILLISLSIKGPGLKVKNKKFNKVICWSVLILGTIFSVYTGGGDFIVILLKSLHIAAVCILITFVSWMVQIFTTYLYSKT